MTGPMKPPPTSDRNRADADPAVDESADAASRTLQPDRDTDEPVLPSVSRHETELGWGDEPGGRDDDWYRRERPPHHE